MDKCWKMNINSTLDIHHVCFEIFVFNEECSLWTIASLSFKTHHQESSVPPPPRSIIFNYRHHLNWLVLCVVSLTELYVLTLVRKSLGKIVLANNRHLRHFVHCVWQYVLYPVRSKNNESCHEITMSLVIFEVLGHLSCIKAWICRGHVSGFCFRVLLS